MRIRTLVLMAAVVLAPACTSSQGAVRDIEGATSAGVRLEAEGEEREAPRYDVERYNRKVAGEENRQDARTDAADERDRRIDEQPVEHKPEAPAGEEEPPRQAVPGEGGWARAFSLPSPAPTYCNTR